MYQQSKEFDKEIEQKYCCGSNNNSFEKKFDDVKRSMVIVGSNARRMETSITIGMVCFCSTISLLTTLHKIYKFGNTPPVGSGIKQDWKIQRSFCQNKYNRILKTAGKMWLVHIR